MILKMLTKLERRMHKHSENLKTENIRKFQTEVTELRDSITKLKNILEGSKIVQMKQKKGSMNFKTRQWHSYNRAANK